MKIIDKLFENVLKKQEVVYDEKYWHEMQMLLEKKDKRVLYYQRAKYVFLILLLVIPCVLVFNRVNTKGNANLSIDNNQNIVSEKQVVIGNNSITTSDLKNEVNSGEIKQNNDVKRFSSHVQPKWKKRLPENSIQGKLNLSKGISNDSLSQNLPISAVFMENQQYFEFDEMGNWGLEKYGFVRFKIKNNTEGFNERVNQILVKKKNRWIAYLSPLLAINQSELSQKQFNSLPLNKKNEQHLKTLSFQLNLTFKRKNIVFGTGLGLQSQQILTNYVSESNVLQFDTTLRLINPSFSKTPKGTNIALLFEDIDTSVLRKQQVMFVDNKAVFNYVHVPVFARYEFSFNKLAFFIQTGMSADFLYRVQGKYLSKSNQEFKELDLNQSKDYKKQILSSQVAFGLKCNISRKVNIVSMYSFQQTLTSMVKSYHQSINQRSFKIGLEVGLF